MKAYKAARELGLPNFDALAALPSGRMLTQSSVVSPFLMKQLQSELFTAEQRLAEGLLTDAVGEAQPNPTPLEEVEASPGPDTLQVFELAREVGHPADTVIDMLRDSTGRLRWTPNDVLSADEILGVRIALADRLAGQRQARRAPAAKLRLPRTLDQLESVRVQTVKGPVTKGEEVLGERLRSLSEGVALMGIDLPGTRENFDVDAIVLLPQMIATVEVKDTRRIGTIKTYLNGAWMVEEDEFQECGGSPVGQALNQARVLAAARREHSELRDLHRIPALLGIHGPAHFELRPLHEVTVECFAYNLEDAIPALIACARKIHAKITAGHVIALFEWLGLSPALRFSRPELELLGFKPF